MPKYIDDIGKLLIKDCENTFLSYNPEFIAQGEIVKGFYNPDIIFIVYMFYHFSISFYFYYI